MAADSRVVDAVRVRLTEAWPLLDDDPVYADQLAEEAADAALHAVAELLAQGVVPDGAPAALRPSDETLVHGGAIAAWLYVAATLDEISATVATKVAEIRRRYADDLRTEAPFGLLLKAEEIHRATGASEKPPRRRPTGNRRARNRPPVDLHDTEEL